MLTNHAWGRGAQATFYPTDLIAEIIRGIRDTADHEHDVDQETVHPSLSTLMSRAGAVHDVHLDPVLAAIQEADRAQLQPSRTTKFRLANGKIQNVNLDHHFKDSYVDEYTREHLDLPLTKDAIVNEMEYFNDGVWEFMSADEAKKQYPNGKILGDGG